MPNILKFNACFDYILSIYSVKTRPEIRRNDIEMSSWSRSQNVFRYEKPVSVVPVLPPKRDLINMVYATPKYKDIAVIMVYFNPAGCFRILQNLLYVKQQLDYASIPYFIAELAYNDTPHVIPKGTNIFQFRTSSYMFSKENLANAVLQQDALKSFTKYVLLDCDVVFDAHDWVDGISVALDSYNVIQPFQYVNQLNLRFKSDNIKASIVYDPVHGHTGYAWAFRRDWLELMGGLYEYALMGGGDKCLAHMAGIPIARIPKPYEGDLPASVRGDPKKTCYLPYNIWHLPHGSLDKRRYIERMDVMSHAMASLRIDHLRNAVDRSTDGIFEWKPVFKTHLNSVLLNYFKSREDDG